MSGGTPSATMAGKVTSVPAPAIELMALPIAATTSARTSWVGLS